MFGIKKRSEQMREKAMHLGLEYMEKPPASIVDAVLGFPLIGSSDSGLCDAQNIMHKRVEEADIYLLDFSLRTSIHDYSSDVFTCVLFQEEVLRYPGFSLKPEQWLDRVLMKFGYEDINFESNPVFSKNYFIRGKEKEAIRNLFTVSGLTEYLRDKKDFCIESTPETLIVYMRSRGVPQKISADNLDVFFQTSVQIHSLLARCLH